ncbi:MAG TPA: TIGR02530 family flagellar biosynthesis protein [Anaerolineaceae bacterium]
MTTPVRFNPSQPSPAVQKPASAAKPASQSSSSFAETLSRVEGLKFSNHAQKRLETRNITLTNEDVGRLQNAVAKAEQRGGKESLVLMDNMAFIVNVRDRLVVTAMDTQNRGEGVFTNIDSVVLAEPNAGQK